MKPGTKERIYPSLGEDYSKPGILIILRLIISVILLGVYYFAKLSAEYELAVLVLATLISGYDVAINAVKDILKKEFLHENLVVSVAVLLSLAINRGTEGVVALILLQLAYLLRDYALYKTRNTICEVIEPDRTILKGADTKTKGIMPDQTIGTTIAVFEGMKVPMDCVIKSGSGKADLSFITGESRSVRLKKGDFLPAGCVCTDGQFTAEVYEMPEKALFRKMSTIIKSGYGEMTETEEAWTKRVSYFMPFSLVVSVVLLFVLHFAYDLSFLEAIRRIITIIAVASPCGILLAVPLTYFSGMALARRLGVLVGNSKALEKSAEIKAIVFNKAGTLTERNYLVTDIKSDKMDSATFLKVAAYAAANSEHHVAKAIVSAYGEEINKELVHEFVESFGMGVSGSVDGIQILLGNEEFMSEKGVDYPTNGFEGTVIHMSVNGIYAGRIVLNESIMPDASVNSLYSLARSGVDRIAMISSDNREKDRAVAAELGIDEYYAECSPKEKALRIGEIKGRIDPRSTLAFVSDHESDVELFAAAGVGIMINGLEFRDELQKTELVIMENGISSLSLIIRVARRTKRFVFAGVILSCCVKLIIMMLAALGLAPIWFGLLIDFCASLAVVLNSTAVFARYD